MNMTKISIRSFNDGQNNHGYNYSDNESSSTDSEIIFDSSDDYDNENNKRMQTKVTNPQHQSNENIEIISSNRKDFNDINELNGSVQVTNLAIQSSNDVTIGNKTIYTGPVTINQFVPPPPLTSNTSDNDCDRNNQRKNSGFFRIFNITSYTTNGKMLSRKSKIILGILTFLIVIFIITGVMCAFLIIPTSEDDISPEDWNVRIIKRDEWGARPPKVELDPFVTTPFRSLIAHTASDGCSTESSCKLRVKSIQNYLMNTANFDDIGYNFLVGGDGMIYEGCGWNKIGIHTIGFNNNSICIAFIGTFITIKPPIKQLKAAQWLLNECVKANKLTKNYKLYGVKQVSSSESPGNELYEIIKKWPHWSDEIE